MTNPPEAEQLFYFIYQLEIGAGLMSHLPHAEQEVTDHITAYSSGSECAQTWMYGFMLF